MATASARPVMYRRVRVDEINTGRQLGLIGHLMLLVVLPVFLLGLGFVKLNSDQVKLKRQLSEMRRDYGLRAKEKENLELEVEMFRNGARIFGQVQRLGLGLQMPQRGQVIRVRNATAAVAGHGQDGAVLVGR